MGWFLVPKLGESCSWAIYDWPKRKRAEVCTMRVTGRASIHGIEGVEIDIVETDPTDENRTGGTGSFGSTVLKHFLTSDVGQIRIFSRDEKKRL